MIYLKCQKKIFTKAGKKFKFYEIKRTRYRIHKQNKNPEIEASEEQKISRKVETKSWWMGNWRHWRERTSIFIQKCLVYMHLTTRFWRAGKKLNSETARGRNQREIQTDIPSISLVFISIDIYSYLYYYFEKKNTNELGWGFVVWNFVKNQTANRIKGQGRIFVHKTQVSVREREREVSRNEKES